MKTFALKLLVVLAFGLAGCGGDGGSGTPDGVAPDGDGSATDPDASADALAFDLQESDLSQDSGPGFDLFQYETDSVEVIPLELYSLEPGKGKTIGGEQVVLSGNGFQDGMVVMFGYGIASDVYVLNKKKAMAITPAGFPGLVDVEVFNPDGQSVRLEAGFLYYNSVNIVEVDPAVGPADGGTPIQLTGTGFTPGAAVIVGNKIAIDTTVLDDATILAVTPPGSPGYANISVAADDGGVTVVNGFYYYVYPEIIQLSPAAGPAGGGSVVIITMEGAHEETEVYFDDLPAQSVAFVDYQTIEVTTPQTVVGFADVTVVTPYGADTREDGFFFFGGATPPQDLKVISVQPASGPTTGGNIVHVAAFGLTSTQDTTVLFGAKVAQVKAVKPALMTMEVVAPAGPKGAVDVTVLNSNGSSVSYGGYTYLPIAQVVDVSPDHGPAAGGTKVLVTGQGFLDDAQVHFGALPAMGVQVVSPTQLQAVTPVGAPGPVDVKVFQAGTKSVLKDAFTYEGALDLFVVDPNFGSMSGGTWIQLVGSGFVGDDVEVLVGGNPCSHVTVESYNLITAKTPPGMPGTVDVEVRVGAAGAALPLAFTYFDPMSYYGGTWGGEVYHSVNVTVLDGNSGAAIPDAFVMLWADPDTPFQGFTDANGQVTFSGVGLLGDQMVTASKECYSNSSVVDYDASNVTLYLFYNCPSMGGGGFPPAFVPPKLHGRVWGFGKYVVIPPGKCDYFGFEFPGLCQACENNGDCPAEGAICVNLGEQGKMCLTSCVNNDECPLGYSCTSLQGGGDDEEFGHCLPLGGEKLVYCSTSKGHYLGENPNNGPDKVADEEGYFTLMMNTLGEVAVVCVGGVLPLCDDDYDCIFGDSMCLNNGCWMSDGRPELDAYAMGVERHIMVSASGQEIFDINILLDIPMNRKVDVFFDDPHWGFSGPNAIFSKVYVDFGSDGVFEFMEFPVKFYSPSVEPTVTFQHLPGNLMGNISDSTFAILGAAVTATSAGQDASKLPATFNLLTALTEFEDDSIMVKGAEGWKGQPSGITQTLFELWGDNWNNVYGVGVDGVIVHFNGYGWQAQPSPAKSTLRTVHGADGLIWAGGDKGEVARFNGVKWEKVPFPVTNNIRGMWSSAKTYVVAVGDWMIYLFDGNSWKPMAGQTPHKFNSVWGVNSQNVWAVGDYGKIVRLVNGVWLNQTSTTGYSLYDVWGTSPGDVWAVGDSGTVVHFDGDSWSAVDSGTNATLRAVFGLSADEVYIVGSKGTILRWDGEELKPETSEPTNQEFLTLYGSKEAGMVMVSGNHQIVLTPFVTPVSILHPQDGSVIDQNYLEWKVDPGPASSFYYTTLQQPGMFEPIMFWDLMTDGDVTYVQLPDFPNIEGTPGVPPGMYIYSVLRVYKEGFDIDNYDFSDLDYRGWRSWSQVQANFVSE